MKIEAKYQRVCYWTAIAVILVLFGILYEQYIDLEDTLHRTNRVSSRQAQLSVQSWCKQVKSRDAKIKMLERHIINMEETKHE